MQFAGFFMNKKGHGNPPLTLTRQCPVGAVGNHGVQAGATPGWVKLCVFDPFQGHFTQGRAVFHNTVHAGKPLAGGTINDRCLVPPAVHVAVFERCLLDQAADAVEGLDDFRVGFPDQFATKQRQRAGVVTITHDRVDDGVVGQTIGLADQEVVDTVGRSGVDYPGARVKADIVGRVNWCNALVTGIGIVKWMAAFEPGQCLAGHCSDNRAVKAPVLQT